MMNAWKKKLVDFKYSKFSAVLDTLLDIFKVSAINGTIQRRDERGKNVAVSLIVLLVYGHRY